MLLFKLRFVMEETELSGIDLRLPRIQWCRYVGFKFPSATLQGPEYCRPELRPLSRMLF